MSTIENNQLEKLYDTAIRAAIEAGELIMEVYGKDFSVDYKEDSSPLTEADRKAHERIEALLSSISPQFPLLSEEGADIDFTERRGWDAYWLVDPLDGTKEFVKRNGEFTVNIALMEKRGSSWYPAFGLVYLPTKRRLYCGVDGQGAWRLDLDAAKAPSFDELKGKADSLPVKSRREGEPLRLVASRSHMSPETEDLIQNLEKRYGAVETVSSGSSIKLCLVAEGSADLYPRFAPTMEWDTAAGDAVCRAAGCKVTEKDGATALSYNKEDLHNTWFLVQGPLTICT